MIDWSLGQVLGLIGFPLFCAASIIDSIIGIRNDSKRGR